MIHATFLSRMSALKYGKFHKLDAIEQASRPPNENPILLIDTSNFFVNIFTGKNQLFALI